MCLKRIATLSSPLTLLSFHSVHSAIVLLTSSIANECLLVLLANLEELQNEERREKENYKDQIEDLKAKCQEKQEIVNISR